MNFMKTFLTLFFCCGISLVYAQEPFAKNGSLALGYGNTSIGHNINLTYRYEIWQKWAVYGGIKYHLNSNDYIGDVERMRFYPERGHAYFVRLHAATLGQHLGLKFGLEKGWAIPHTVMDIRAFYDFQFTSPIDNYIITADVDSMEQIHVRTPAPDGYGGKRYIMEHHLGIILAVQATRRIHINLSAGVGLNRFYRSLNLQPGLFNSNKPVLSHMLGFGVEYRIK